MAQQKAGRKVGRHKRNGQAARYRNEQRKDKSHLRRIKKHLVRFTGDRVAVEAQHNYEIKLGIIRAKH